jgi:uncharacterized protein
MKRLLANLIEFYQIYLSFDRGVLAYFAPGGACRYPISCSEYAKQSILRYGVLKGTILGLKRIGSCR